MTKSKSFISIFIPSATVFISSFCIMVLELVASRLIARHLGSSLYTWTAVIGVILAGITIGNYLGGRIADKFRAGKSIAVICTICSAACIATIILNNIVGDWIWLWHTSWPLHVFSYVCIVFLLPSAMMGAISPVVAKMALDRGLPAGRTIGDIYAWSAAGSIAGTFVAGYWLIAAMGTINIIWVIGAVLLLMSILYWRKFWLLYIWIIIFIASMTIAIIPAKWAQRVALAVALRSLPMPAIIYEDESRYSRITVRQSFANPNERFFYQDTLMHSTILMNDILNLQYYYEKIYAAVTEGLSKNKEKLNVMAIGGGGYVFPRYIEKVWPGSRIDVAEIDPAVTKAATQAFGLEKNTTINTVNMDARNYVDQLLEQKHTGRQIPRYDFVYGDAFNEFSVPFQLVTKEFNDKIFAILNDDGVYMINLIDIFDSGLFFGSVINTLEKTFPYVYMVSEIVPHSSRNTFIIISAKHKLDLENIISQYKKEKLELWYLNASDINELRQKSQNLVLTDNYCPVENLLAPVVRDSATEISVAKFLELAKEFKQKGQFAKSIENYLSVIKIEPSTSVQSYDEIGIMYAKMGNPQQAVDALNKAIQYNEKSDNKINMATTYYNLGSVLKDLGRQEEALEQFRKAVEEPGTSVQSYNEIGIMYAKMGKPQQAADALNKAIQYNDKSDNKINMTPTYYNLGSILKDLGRREEALEQFRKAVEESQRASNQNPNDYVSWEQLGDTFAKMEDFKAAAEAYKKALALKPDKPDVLNKLGCALTCTGNFDEAIPFYNKALQIAPDAIDTRLNLGLALINSGKLAQAVEEYEKVLQIEPKNAVVHNDLGMILCSQGNLDEGIKHFNQALQIDQNYTAARNNLNNALTEKQKSINK